MPQSIYLPQDPRWAMLGQAVGGTTQFIYQLALNKIAHNMQMDIADRQIEAKKIEAQQERQFKVGQAKERANVESGQIRQRAELEAQQPTAAQKNYYEAVLGGYKGSFAEYQKEIGKAGASQINIGDKLTSAVATDIQKQMFDVEGSLHSLESVARLYKPGYQDLATRWDMNLMELRDKFKGFPGVKRLSPQEKKGLSEYSTYRKRAVKQYAEQIHKLAGATLSKQEEKLYSDSLPKPGTGLFDGDSTVVFESSLKNTYEQLLKSHARYKYYLSEGYKPGELKALHESNRIMSMDKFDEIINQKAMQYEQEILQTNPNVTNVKDLVLKRLRDEFGINFGGK